MKLMNIKNKKILIPLLLVSLISIGYIIYISALKGKLPAKKTTISETGASYNNLTPGLSTTSDITKIMGETIRETQNGSESILEYKSNNPNFNNQFSVDSGVLTLVKQVVSSKDNIKISNINQKYGNYEYVLYKSSSYTGFNLYIYPDKGIAYVGHQGSGIVLEIWYFKPMTFDEFKTNFGQAFSETPVVGQ